MAHAQYITYAEYQTYGGMLDSAVFLPLELKSRKRIDYLTDSRVQRMEAVPEAVKLCAYALIKMEDMAGAETQINNPTATSFSTDGYSESYGNALSVDAAKVQMNKTVVEYLYGELDDNGVPLLYRGVKV